MMDVSITPSMSSRKVLVGIDKNAKLTRRGIRQGFYNLGKDLHSTARRKILEGPKSGRLYVIKQNGRRRRHRASRAGEAPANFSGTLRRSIGFIVKGANRLEFGSIKGRGADAYAKELELDPRGRLKGKRPYLKTAVQINERNAKLHFVREIKKAHKY